MEFFLIILLIVFIFLVAKSIDEKTNRITSKVTPLIITMILRITYMIMKQIKLFLLLMNGKEWRYICGRRFYRSWEAKNVSEIYMLVKLFF